MITIMVLSFHAFNIPSNSEINFTIVEEFDLLKNSLF